MKYILEEFPTPTRIKPTKGKIHLTDDLVATDLTSFHPPAFPVTTLCGRVLSGFEILGVWAPREHGVEDTCAKCRTAVGGYSRIRRLTR